MATKGPEVFCSNFFFLCSKIIHFKYSNYNMSFFMTPPWHANEFHNIQFNSLSSSISTYIHVSVFVLSSLGIRPPLIAPGRFGVLQESYLAKCQTCQEQWEAAAFPMSCLILFYYTYTAALGSFVVSHHSACFLINCFTFLGSLPPMKSCF